MKTSISISLLLILSSALLAQSVYEESFTIPEYDAGNPEHFLISSANDWDHVNDVDKTCFFIMPGLYHSAGTDQGRIVLTASGTSSEKRYISLYNGNDIHPGALNKNDMAKVGFIFQNADYWVLDRMSYWDPVGNIGFEAILVKNSSNNIINRYYSENVQGGTIVFMDDSNNNTFQNSRIVKTNFKDFIDRGAIEINHRGEVPSTIKNTKVLNNEVVNLVDAFQAVKVGDASQAGINYEGTIVDYNHFYICDAIYTNCSGVHDPDGNCAYAENGIDLKCGSDNPDNPMIISNNKMWGYRLSDGTNSYLDDFGHAMVAHFNVKNLIVNNNLFWNSARGIAADGPRHGSALEDAEFRENVILDIKEFGIVFWHAVNLNFHDNILKDIGRDLGAFSVWVGINECTDLSYIDNLMLETHDLYGASVQNTSGLTVSGNGYYESRRGDFLHGSDSIYLSDPTTEYDDLVFITDRYTLNPRTITIPHVGDYIASDEEYIPVSNAISEKEAIDNNIIIYPNPTNGTATIFLNSVCEKITVQVYSSTGQALSKETYHNIERIPVSMDYTPGVYFIKVWSGTKMLGTIKII